MKGHPVVLGRGVIDFPPIIDYLKETDFDGQALGEIGLEGTAEMKAFMVDELELRIELSLWRCDNRCLAKLDRQSRSKSSIGHCHVNDPGLAIYSTTRAFVIPALCVV